MVYFISPPHLKSVPQICQMFYSYSIFISMTISKSVEMFLECNVANKFKNKCIVMENCIIEP